MNVSAPPTTFPQFPILIGSLVDFQELAVILRLSMDLHHQTNSQILPETYRKVHRMLTVSLRRFKYITDILAEAGISLTSTVALNDEGITEDVRKLIRSEEMNLLVIGSYFKSSAEDMEVLEDAGNLSDGNRATYEDLERLAADIRRDLRRMKERVEGSKELK